MKQKFRQKISLREINTNVNYSGERSPYWDFMLRQVHAEEDHEIKENVYANPDVLSEDEHLYHRPLSEEGEIKFQLIRTMIEELTPQQQKVLQLCGFEGLTQKQAAKELGITQPTVNEILQTIQRRIRIRYEEIKKSHE